MVGAGISVNAGIPDFRTPGTGLYDNLHKYNLPDPTAVFDINFFRENPAPFYLLARELFPGQYLPTPTHYFLRLLHEKGQSLSLSLSPSLALAICLSLSPSRSLPLCLSLPLSPSFCAPPPPPHPLFPSPV